MGQPTQLDDNLHWYKDAIIYELHIKAFCDSNGDGIGDFNGLLTKLDYLQELGITAIWLLPFYPSPLKDDGYDIADYYSINPSYGTITQFQQLLDEAHKRGLKVITELVINHTSDQHPWFQRARTAPVGSPERDFYVWTDDPNQYKDVRIIFQDFEASNWTWDPVAQQYYWHRFFHHQPDLNYDSPLVQEEIFKVLDYWCEMGVDGFRLDAVPYLYEREGTNGENLPETHAFLKRLRAHIDIKFPGTVFLAEANMWPEDSASYFGNGDECHMNYHFPVMPRMFMAVQMEDRFPITDIFEQTPPIPETCQWAMFLRNHDELTLEMVTDEERDYMYRVYAKDPRAKINLGIRHRLAPLMDNNRRRIELMNCLLFSMPGTPVIYYGDEIGMGDNFYLGDRDGVRTPMQWSPDRNAGFSNANPQRLYLPVIIDPEYNYNSVNVEMQRWNTSSLFWFMKRLINMRKSYKVFGRGDLRFINASNHKVLAFTRTYQDETLLVVVNLSKYSQPVEIDLSEFKGYYPVELFSSNRFPLIKEDSPYFLTMGSNAFEWFKLEKAGANIHRSINLPTVRLNTWEDISSDRIKVQLEREVLSSYLLKNEWYTSKQRRIQAINITNRSIIPLEHTSMFLLLAEVYYENGLPESYQVPLVFVGHKAAGKLNESCPQAIIAAAIVGEEEGILADALFVTKAQHALLKKVAHKESIDLGASTINFYSEEEFAPKLADQPEPKSRVTDDDGFTTIHYDNGYFLKIYRKIDPTTNPDLELTRYLSEESKFPHIPRYAGAIEWRFQKDTIALGMLQEFFENHGNGYEFMLTRINNYIERILARHHAPGEFSLPEDVLMQPVSFDMLDERLKLLLGSTASDQARLIGKRTGEMHLALAAASRYRDFAPEEFSLHYQRSLFSSMQSKVREAYDKISANEEIRNRYEGTLKVILNSRNALLDKLKRIYKKKIDAVKIRVHGNYTLKQILFTGKDLLIHNFSGDPYRTFSERRLKRSPLRDISSMILSFRYIAHYGFIKSTHIPKEDMVQYLYFAELWSEYMISFFLDAYLKTVAESTFIPSDKSELKMLLEVFLVERALHDIRRDRVSDPELMIVPLKTIYDIVNEKQKVTLREMATA